MKSNAYRSLNAAAAERADVKAKAAWNEALQWEAEQLIMEKVTEAETRYSCSTPQEDEASLREALLPLDEYGEVSEHEEEHMAVAAAIVAADLGNTGGFDAPAVRHNLDDFAPRV